MPMFVTFIYLYFRVNFSQGGWVLASSKIMCMHSSTLLQKPHQVYICLCVFYGSQDVRITGAALMRPRHVCSCNMRGIIRVVLACLFLHDCSVSHCHPWQINAIFCAA